MQPSITSGSRSGRTTTSRPSSSEPPTTRCSGSVVRQRRGLRPLRLSSVAHAALRGMAGQLITSSEARRIERAVIATTMPRDRDLRLPPSTADLAALTPARLERAGLAGRRAAALVRVCRTLELERLHEHPTPAVVSRIVREPQLGPWTAGVICLEGLGRYDHGLVGDLGLIRLCERQLGRPATRGRHGDAPRTLGRVGRPGEHVLPAPPARRHARREGARPRRAGLTAQRTGCYGARMAPSSRTSARPFARSGSSMPGS